MTDAEQKLKKSHCRRHSWLAVGFAPFHTIYECVACCRSKVVHHG